MRCSRREGARRAWQGTFRQPASRALTDPRS
jgi:hypothetical protein